ncbi:DMT family transporter [Leptolyngbya sp. FACHB-261]|nr:DMT family transporter [Leptolyngbya sp. FACHB-261]
MLNLDLLALRGELAALCGAVLWALVAAIYTRAGQQVSPLGLNLSKSTIAIGLLGVTIALQGEAGPGLGRPLLLLLLSGAVGVGLGDTAYFEALKELGAQRALLLEALAPPLTALLALIFLQETLSLGAWFGILLTVLGVTWVISERSSRRLPRAIAPLKRPWRGINFGLLAALGNGSSAVLARSALADTSVSPIWAALLRLGAGVLALLLWGSAQGQINRKHLLAPPNAVNPLWQPWHLFGALVIASFGGTYLGIWLQQIALKFTAAGIAQALGSTSPLFILPIALCLGETVSLRALAGVLVAVMGVAMLFSLR